MVHGTEIIVIALVVLILFGASAIPKFMKSLGQAKAELEKGYKEGLKEAATGADGQEDKNKGST
jgi:sec-independent protein translocase protein TatA